MIKYSFQMHCCTNCLKSNQKINLFGMKNETSNFEPLPLKEQADGKKLWIINGYRVWAKSYDEAIELADIIECL